MVSHKSKFSREVRDKGQVDVGNKQNTFGNKLNKMAHLRHHRRHVHFNEHSHSCEGIIATIIRENDLHEAVMDALDGMRKKKTAAAVDTTEKEHSMSGVVAVAAEAVTTTTTTTTLTERSQSNEEVDNNWST